MTAATCAQLHGADSFTLFVRFYAGFWFYARKR